MDVLSLTNDASNSLLRIPVEIWREIIDQLLSDPVRFGVDPFYPGCNLHTALDQWLDERPLRILEVQRGQLRLVSRSWKALAKSSRWQYFRVNLPLEIKKPEPRIYSAGRLKLRDYCSVCGWNWSRSNHRCSYCHSFTDRIALEDILPQDVDYRPPRAQILTFPFWENDTVASILHERTLRYFQNSVRALVIRTTLSLRVDVWEILSNLTFLCILLRAIEDGSIPTPPSATLFPFMKTFRLIAEKNTDCTFLEHWEMPVLAHFEVITAQMGGKHPPIYTFIENCGRNMISLRLRFEFCEILLPENIWQVVPRLEYLAVGTLHQNPDSDIPTFPSRPGEHPLHTFAILDSKEFRGFARLDLIALIGQWKGITTIADSHIWDTSIEVFEDECQSVVEVNSPISAYYCSCLGTLYNACMDRGIRYEDRTGRSYAEFSMEKSL